MEKFSITIARGYGSGGRTIGKMLAEELGIPFYDRELFKIKSSYRITPHIKVLTIANLRHFFYASIKLFTNQ